MSLGLQTLPENAAKFTSLLRNALKRSLLYSCCYLIVSNLRYHVACRVKAMVFICQFFNGNNHGKLKFSNSIMAST